MGPVAHATGRDISPSGLHYLRLVWNYEAPPWDVCRYRMDSTSTILLLERLDKMWNY